MDILAHGLWTNLLYRTLPVRNDKKLLWWGILFGIAPDLISFSPIFIYAVWGWISGRLNFVFGPELTGNVFGRYAENSYNYTHSLLLWGIAMLVVFFISKKFPWVLVGWGLHILIDLFTHPGFYRTPFLFPISDFRNPYAVSWAHPVFMAINYLLLLMFYVWIVARRRKSQKAI